MPHSVRVFVLFALSGAAGLTIEAYNRYFRALATPFGPLSLGLLLVGCLFLVKKKRRLRRAAAAINLCFWGTYLWMGLHTGWRHASWVYYYRDWKLFSHNGRISLRTPIGKSPPSSGAYISCNFSLKGWRDYLDNQPNLCTAFDAELKLSMHLHDQETDQGYLREFQLNQFKVERRSLLGEAIHRGSMRIVWTKQTQGWRASYRLHGIYQVFEQEIAHGRSRVVESFSRDSDGNLKSLTESSSLGLSPEDIFAVYDKQGILKELPKADPQQSFAFPSQIDVSRFLKYRLPSTLAPNQTL